MSTPASVPHFERQIRNIKQQAYRQSRKANEALAAWFSPIGSALDLIDFERAAERQQLVVRQLAATEAVLEGILRK